LGVVYDHTQSMQLAYLVPLLCFVPVLYYGIRCKQLTV
jgi:fucose permease